MSAYVWLRAAPPPNTDHHAIYTQGVVTRNKLELLQRVLQLRFEAQAPTDDTLSLLAVETDPYAIEELVAAFGNRKSSTGTDLVEYVVSDATIALVVEAAQRSHRRRTPVQQAYLDYRGY